jgi:hypothetical protein
VGAENVIRASQHLASAKSLDLGMILGRVSTTPLLDHHQAVGIAAFDSE